MLLKLVLRKRKWRFATSLSKERVQLLKSEPTFRHITNRIVSEMKIICGFKDPISSYPIDGFRVVFSIDVSKATFDLFFNSINGYRGSYYKSTRRGLKNNRYFIRTLIPYLSKPNLIENVTVAEIKKSLGHKYAKAWLAEAGNRICNECGGEFPQPQDKIPEILNNRWELSSKDKSVSGRKAPYLTRIRIIGAFIKKSGKPFISRNKLNRHNHIHDWGWS